MKEKKKKGLYTYQKVILSYFMSFTICIWALYPFMYKILNYPPGTVDTQFQIEYGGLTYTKQFFVIYLFIVIVFILFQRFVLFRKIADWEKHGDTKYTTEDVRYTLLTAPTKFYLLQIIIPFVAVTIGLGMPIVKHEVETSGITVAILLVSIFAFNATISYVFSRNLFKTVLYKTFKENNVIKKHTSLSNDMMLLLIPLLIAGLFFTVIVSYSRLINVRGNDIYRYYKQELSYAFDENVSYTENEVIDKMNNLEYLSQSDTYFIIDENKNITTSNGVELTDFFQKYIFELSDENEGRAYEHYAVNTQGYIKHIIVDNQNYIIGIRYPISGGDALNYIVITFVILFGVISMLIWYYSESLASQIRLIVSGLNEINTKNNEEFKRIPVISNDELGELTVEFNKIQNLTKNNIEQIHNNQQMLMERERFASLGQLIGGIAHNLKTPIMSIAGGTEALTDLIKEYDASIGDPEVTNDDHHAIAKDMQEWVDKIKTHTSYMSDVITAVKGQAISSSENVQSFTIDELLNRVSILMKHELKHALVELRYDLEIDKEFTMHGNINALVQVIDNLISNAIQSYGGKPDSVIDFIVNKDDKNINFAIRDYGCGMSKEIQKKLFKEMITTKGKNGTGLGLYMSYSNIKAKFNGDITFESKVGEGTIFIISIPYEKS